MASAARVARRSVADRSLRVLVSPTPITFGERRSVLQVLEQYGPIEAFQITPGYQANFISVAKETSTATKLVSCSPLSYVAPAPHVHKDINVADLGEIEISAAAHSPPRPVSQAPRTEGRHFTVEVFPAPDYEHKYAMTSSPLHSSWPNDYRKNKSFVTASLKQSLPGTIAGSGLSHWQFEESRRPKMTSKTDRLQLKSWLPSKMQR